MSRIATVNPNTGVQEQGFAALSAHELEQRLARAEAAASLLRDAGFAQRASWALATADILESEIEQAARIVTIEMGKPIAQSRSEAQKCVKALRFYAEHSERFLADEPLADPSAVGASSALTQYQPLGVVLAVMPWNYPLWQVIRFAAPTLMAGNACLLKHASNVPQAALFLESLFERGGFPRGSFQSLLIGSDQVADVIADRRVHAVTLTGSEAAGRSVGATAGEKLKKSVLELGGSDPFIVMPSADLSAAAATAATARLINNGQSCIAAKRFIVHQEVYEAFRTALVEQFAQRTVGDPLEESTDVGPLATEAGRDELAELVDDALAHGASALVGGERMQRAGWFYPPTLLENVTPAARLHQEEAFGPVATLYRVSSLDEAIGLANNTRFGLSSSFWSENEQDIEQALRSIQAGAVFVNGMTVSHPELPFGGIKDSGYGRELAAVGIREFCNLKTVWRR